VLLQCVVLGAEFIYRLYWCLTVIRWCCRWDYWITHYEDLLPIVCE